MIAAETFTPRAQHGIPFATYVQAQAVNWSTLKEMRKSPRHYAAAMLAPRADSTTLARGRAFHTAVLEPDRMLVDYSVWTGGRRAGKLWTEWKAHQGERTILTVDEYHTMHAMKDAVCAHPVASRYLAKAQREVTITWVDAATGLPCKARADLLAEIDGRTYLMDLKSAVDIDARKFGGAAARYGYQCQLAWYARGCKAVGIDLAGVGIIACESDTPHDVGVFTLDEDTLYAGDEECGELIARVKECFDRNDWRGRYAAEEPLQLPAWWYADDAEASELGIVIGSNGSAAADEEA